MRLLQDYLSFQGFYAKKRSNLGKSSRSQTRRSIERLSKSVYESFGWSIAETNAVPLPTDKVDALYGKPQRVLDRARQVFYELLMAVQPRLIMVHGEDALKAFIEMVKCRDLAHEFPYGTLKKLRDKELLVPYMNISYAGTGRRAAGAEVLVSRHFSKFHFDAEAFSLLERRLKRRIRTVLIRSARRG